MPQSEMSESDEVFDEVIVGGGSAGCVLANRLSADPARRVLLVEAGVDTLPGNVPPEILDSYPMALFFGDQYIWPGLKATTAHEPGDRSHQRAYEQARVMGGGSSINVQAANRGLPRDYDEWAELGADGWSWTEVLPYFVSSKRSQLRGPLHGVDGPLPIRRIMPEQWPAFGHAVAKAFDAWVSRGGSTRTANSRTAFFHRPFQPGGPARLHRDSLSDRPPGPRQPGDRPESRVTKLFVSGRRAEELTIRRQDGTTRRVRARSVTLTAGAFQSPAILMRSGIGPGTHLEVLGDRGRHRSPGGRPEPARPPDPHFLAVPPTPCGFV